MNFPNSSCGSAVCVAAISVYIHAMNILTYYQSWPLSMGVPLAGTFMPGDIAARNLSSAIASNS